MVSINQRVYIHTTYFSFRYLKKIRFNGNLCKKKNIEIVLCIYDTLTEKLFFVGGRSRRNRDTSNAQLQSRTMSRTSQASGSTAQGADLNNLTGGPYSEEALSAIK